MKEETKKDRLAQRDKVNGMFEFVHPLSYFSFILDHSILENINLYLSLNHDRTC